MGSYFVKKNWLTETLWFIQDQDEDEEEEEGSLKDFIDDGSSDEESVVGSDSDIQEVEETGEEKKRTTRGDKVSCLSPPPLLKFLFLQYMSYVGVHRRNWLSFFVFELKKTEIFSL